MTRLAVGRLALILGTCGVNLPCVQAQSKLATDIKAADIQAVVTAPTGGADRQIKVVDIGTHNVAVGVLRRGKTMPGAPVGAINHEQVTEVYYVISGSGTLLTGGTVDNAKAAPADSEIVTTAVGPSNNGVFREPAQKRKLEAGDMVIIPPAFTTDSLTLRTTSSMSRCAPIRNTCYPPDT